MNRFFYFFKLIRINNLLIIALTQTLVFFFLLEENKVTYFILLLLITFFITASGYIINDIFDVKSDQINKQDLIIGNHISARNAIVWYYLFSSIAIILAIYLLYLNENFYLFVIILSSIYLLWRYSNRYKHSFFIGNFIVSLLTSLSIFNVFLVSSNDSTTSFVFDLTLMFSIFSFLLTFTREIIKDLEDIDGDKLMNSQNIASKLNLEQSKQIIIGVLTLVLFLMLIGCYYFSSKIITLKPMSILMYSSLLFFMSLFSIFKVKKSKEKKDYIYISRLLKLIMLLGVLSIPTIYYI